MEKVGKLFIKCPSTEKEVFTGVSITKKALMTAQTNSSVKCPHCGEMHRWSKADANLKY